MKVSTQLKSGWYPGGSYTQTCENIEFDPGTRHLQAACQRADGMAWNWSEMIVPDEYDDISNCNGVLALNYC